MKVSGFVYAGLTEPRKVKAFDIFSKVKAFLYTAYIETKKQVSLAFLIYVVSDTWMYSAAGRTPAAPYGVCLNIPSCLHTF